MPIKVTCTCGRTLTAPDSAAGKQGKCPSCGNRLPIVADEEPVLLTEAPSMPLGFVADLGRVQCSYSELRFSFHVEKDGIAFLEIIARDELDDENPGFVMLRLDDDRYEQFLRAVKATEETVRKYRQANPSRRLVEVFRKN